MIQETIRNFGIGEKIRALRREKKMGLVELGKHSGLSAALLSKIETGKLIPPLPTLLRIAMVFSVGLDYFFTDESGRHFVAVSKHAPDHLGDLIAPSPDLKLNAAIHQLGTAPMQLSSVTAGTAMIYILAGQVRAEVGEDTWTVEEGDCVTFSLHLPHSVSALVNEARALMLIVP